MYISVRIALCPPTLKSQTLTLNFTATSTNSLKHLVDDDYTSRTLYIVVVRERAESG
jgi:hypothetical protein